jgi:DNA-binding NarL/FixJ family response regulator
MSESLASGIEVARQIRQQSPSSKMVFVSQHDSVQMVDEALRVGGYGYVAKIDASLELLTAIRSLKEDVFSSVGSCGVRAGLKNRNGVLRFETC